jgi:hypothetical protein
MLEHRFLSKIKKVSSGCWEWQSTLQQQGYGHFWFEGRQMMAHRMAYQLFRGEIPRGILVCHTCDNPRCVNPEHLFLGTSKDKAIDRNQKFRNWGRRKLSDEAVREILELIKEGNLVQREIAAKFGVNQDCISRIKQGRRYYLKSPTLNNL